MTRDRPRRSVDLFGDERGVSVAVTHVLAIGITTLLITALLVGASGVLSQQREDAARQQLDTIGNRLAGQIAKADTMVDDDGPAENATFVVDQPATVSGGSYSVRVKDGSACGLPDRPPGAVPDACLELVPSNPDVDIRPVRVPVHNESEFTLTSRTGGEFNITVEES
ncbi:hypothetical protein BRD00_10455 [Halobacteriales archaeon QS_8_69_26]|nr:MAG: hypothetical protein BRD00_10455 [Halobacteriales archaeon QS_8_69_26]